MPTNRRNNKRSMTTNTRGRVQLSKEVNYLKSIINSELHFKSNPVIAKLIPDTASITGLSAIIQGTNAGQRNGNSILPKYVNCKCTLTKRPGQTKLTEVVRVIFFLWKEAKEPLITDLLESSDVFSFYNREQKGGNPRDRGMTILHDKSYTLIKDFKPVVNLKIDMRMNRPGQKNPVHIVYNASSASSARNGLFMALIGQETSAAQQAEFDGQILFKFYDN